MARMPATTDTTPASTGTHQDRTASVEAIGRSYEPATAGASSDPDEPPQAVPTRVPAHALTPVRLLVPPRRGCDVCGHVPLERVLRRPRADRRVGLPDTARAHRPEPALAHGRGNHERRWLRPRLVRAGERGSGALPQRGTGVERRQPARPRGPRRVPPLPRPHPGGDRQPGATDQLPPLPVWPLAVRAQRVHRRFPADTPAGDAVPRRRALRRDGGLDRL